MRTYTVIISAFRSTSGDPCARVAEMLGSPDTVRQIEDEIGSPVRIEPVLLDRDGKDGSNVTAAWSALEPTISRIAPDMILVLGYRPGAYGVCLERCAVNAGSATVETELVPGDAAAYWTRLPLHRILCSFLGKVPASITSGPDDTLSGALTYYVLRQCAQTAMLGGLLELPDIKDSDAPLTFAGVSGQQMLEAARQTVSQTLLYLADLRSEDRQSV
ncbi:MAG: hypothetical protein IIT36_03730 [Aeriscardovia sp.]|nr:hypothetical protein [Aeriscardovia sp.]